MAEWGKNKTVGIAAGVIVMLCIIFLTIIIIKKRSPAPMSPEQKAKMEAVIKAMQSPVKTK